MARSQDTPRADAPDRHRATLTMYSPLSAIVRPQPVTVTLDSTVRAALETMERMRMGSIVVTDAAGTVPLGIFTLQDLLRRVALPGGDLEQPIAGVMTSGLITLGPSATAHQAAMTMARNGVRRVVVVDAERRLVGVVSQEDLFGLQREGVRGISAEIQAARDAAGLRGVADGIRRLAGDLMAQGTSPEMLTHAISTLNDLLTTRVLELTADEHELPIVPMCWIALGSEGRLEQTFSTDQDNAIIFDAQDGDAEEVRAALLPFARGVNEKLDACGFPLCKGGIMAGNPTWCLTVAEWRRTFFKWIHEPHPDALLNASVFFDLRPIWGNDSLAEELRAFLLAEASGRAAFLRLMAENALDCQPPLGMVRDFVYDRSKEFPHTIDLKLHGSRPFVDAARIFSLAHGVTHTNTAQRLRALPGESDASVAALVDGFTFVHLLRLRNHASPRGARGGANRVDPRELNELERHVLKEAFRQARKLQNRLVAEYHRT